MIFQKKWMVLLLALLMGVVLVVTGCADDAAPPADPGAAEEPEVFRYAMSGAYQPFSYFDENDNLVGFDVEIGAALAEAMGMEAEPVPTPWQALPMGLGTRYEAIIGSMTITEERLQKFDFSDPYYRSGPKVFVQADSGITSVEDLTADSTIAVLMESVYEDLAAEITDNLKFYESDMLALRELGSGRADAVITDQIVGLTNARELDLDIIAVGDILIVEEIGIAIPKGNPELLARINRALADIKADGTYLAICGKYVGGDISGD